MLATKVQQCLHFLNVAQFYKVLQKFMMCQVLKIGNCV